jgi:hypothetical protein
MAHCPIPAETAGALPGALVCLLGFSAARLTAACFFAFVETLADFTRAK